MKHFSVQLHSSMGKLLDMISYYDSIVDGIAHLTTVTEVCLRNLDEILQLDLADSKNSQEGVVHKCDNVTVCKICSFEIEIVASICAFSVFS